MTSISSYSTRARPPNPLAADPVWVHRWIFPPSRIPTYPRADHLLWVLRRFERAVDIIQRYAASSAHWRELVVDSLPTNRNQLSLLQQSTQERSNTDQLRW